MEIAPVLERWRRSCRQDVEAAKDERADDPHGRCDAAPDRAAGRRRRAGHWLNGMTESGLIDGVTAYNTTLWGGIEIVGGKERSTQAVIRNSIVHNVYGDGIVLWHVEQGLIEKCTAYDTGLQPPPQTIGTPSSIWTWSCYDCIVQYNESYRAFSPDVDGGCYDIDWGTKNNIYQYNYGHDCSGYCISVFGAGGLITENAVVRYNVCANNGRSLSLASAQGDIYLSTWENGHLDGVLIYNNTFYWNPEINTSAMVNRAEFTGSRPNLFANNLLVSTASWLIDSNASLKFDHNLYWYEGDRPTIWTYGKEVYTGLVDFQKSGQEAYGLFADPKLQGSTYHDLGFPKKAFNPLKGSPAIDAGLDLGAMGERDFFGNPIPQGLAYDIGACETK